MKNNKKHNSPLSQTVNLGSKCENNSSNPICGDLSEKQNEYDKKDRNTCVDFENYYDDILPEDTDIVKSQTKPFNYLP